MNWQRIVDAPPPRDRDIFAIAAGTGLREPHQRPCGQRLRWDASAQCWMQFVGGDAAGAHGTWHRPFFLPTHWAPVAEAGAAPAPMFAP